MKTDHTRKTKNNIVKTIDIATIRTMRKRGCVLRQIAEKLGVAISTIVKALRVYGDKDAEDKVKVCYKSESIRTIKNQEL